MNANQVLWSGKREEKKEKEKKREKEATETCCSGRCGSLHVLRNTTSAFNVAAASKKSAQMNSILSNTP